jgi:ribosomal protein S13
VDEVFTVTSRTKDSVKIRAAEVLEPMALAVPTESQLHRLAEDTLLTFNDAIQNGGDFSTLYAEASDRWKYRGKDPRDLTYVGSDPLRVVGGDPFNEENRLTATALRRAFDAAIQAKIDISALKGARMILSEPARINSEGVLRIAGTFDCVATQGEAKMPRKLDFMLEYVFESSRWKLFGITVNLLVPRVNGTQ